MAETAEEKAAREKREAEEKEAREREEREEREKADAKKPPWGDEEENFDAERAWELIQNLRADVSKLKTERDEARDKAKKLEDEKLSDQERKDKEAREATERATAAETEAIRLRVAMKHGLEEEDLDLLGTGDEEAIEARAKRLAERTAPTSDDVAPRRPRERLRPGAAPAATPEDNDPAALAEQVPRGW
jgi:hypothetical protein